MTEEIKNGPAPLRAGGAVKAIVPQTFEDAYRIAKMAVASGMTPYGIDTPEKAAIVIMHGLELGLSPMMALQRIALVNNRPSIWGDAAIGLVRASGLCAYVKEWIVGTGDNRIAFCETLRNGEKEMVTRKYSVADAKQAKLWGKKNRNGSDSPWITNEERMLQMRARGFCLRDAYADVLGGLYLKEEMEDDFGKAQEPVRPPVPADIPAQIEHRPPVPMDLIEDAEPAPVVVEWTETAEVEVVS